MDELISVIVPVYNVENYIDNCVKSILEQTYKSFELILINDGSTDSSLLKCKQLEQKDSRIKVLNRQNGGASAARNSGLDVATGNYIVFIDSDDYVSKNYLENLYKAAKINNYDIVQCNLSATTKIMNDVPKVNFDPNHVKEITKIQALNDRLYKVSIWGKIYSSSIFKGFHFKEGIVYEDDASYYIFIDKANKISLIDESLYYYYMSDNSVMRNNSDISLEFINIYEERINYFKNKKNDILVEGTYGRYCLVLMLTLAKCLKNKKNINDIDSIINIYKTYYPKVMKSKYINFKDKLIFFIFRLSPRCIGNIIGKVKC